MGREIRIVPKIWKHPKDSNGNYKPLFDGDFSQVLAEWEEEKEQWELGYRKDWETDKFVLIDEKYKDLSFEEMEGNKPLSQNYMPEWKPEEQTHLMMYETCSEGTPISPAFETPEELAHWLADNNASAMGYKTATYEQWLNVCKGEFACSMIVTNGKLMSGVEATTELKKSKKE